MNDIEKECRYIVLHPNEKYKVEKLNNLVESAKTIGYALEFMIGQNLYGNPYIQGYNLDKIQ